MPVKIPDNLPAVKILRDENIFVMTEGRATSQDIRPLRICILNLMPIKEVTETQLLRLIGNTPLQVEVTLLRTATHTPRNTPTEHLRAFYMTYNDVKDQKFDGLIITGAPVEMLKFEDVDYWPELTEIIEWARAHVFSTLYICWAAQAGLYYHYGVPKHELASKCFGVFKHVVLEPGDPLLRGFDAFFYAPHSRHTEIRAEDILKSPDLTLLSVSERAGVYLVTNRATNQVFVTGHSEYDPYTLKAEYERDLKKGLANVPFPYHYFQGNDPGNPPDVRWRAHSHLLFQNWLNYYVYQETPYDIELIGAASCTSH